MSFFISFFLIFNKKEISFFSSILFVFKGSNFWQSFLFSLSASYESIDTVLFSLLSIYIKFYRGFFKIFPQLKDSFLNFPI